MSDRFVAPIPQNVRIIVTAVVALLACLLLAPGRTWAQDAAAPQDAAANPQQPAQRILRNAHILVRVRSATDGLPIPNVTVSTDSETERPYYDLTGQDGTVRLGVTPGTYTVILNGAVAGYETRREVNRQTGRPYYPPGNEPFRENITVVAGQEVTLDFVLIPRIDTENINQRIELIDRNETGVVTRRDRRFFELYPLGAGNQQSLPDLLLSVPGFVNDAINQVHPRGENAVAAATYMNGTLLPPVPAGTAAQVIAPDSINSFTARVGGFSPEYGGGSGAILDLQTRDVQPDHPFLDLTYRGGDYSTNEVYLNFGNTLPFHASETKKGFIERMRYTFSLSQRYTNEALEAPQDGYPNSANYGASEIFFGKIDFDLHNNSTITGLFNFSSGRTGIANRSGLNDSFAPYGAGFGFLGESSSQSGLPSQDQLGQNFRQKDNNSLMMLQFAKKELNPTTHRNENRALFAVGITSNTLFQGSQEGTPIVGYHHLPADSSIEYLPTVLNDYQQILLQADFTPRPSARHQVKYGVSYRDISGLDSFQLIPQSQTAVNELYQLDPLMLPPGQLLPGTQDARGNPVFRIDTSVPNPATPVLYADKDGWYAAGYIQDTFKIKPTFRVNYGLRVDSFNQNIRTQVQTPIPTGGPNDGKPIDLPGVTSTTLSPRINMALVLPQRGIFRDPTIVRASYNRIVTPPQMNQGVFLRYQPHTNQSTFADIAIPQTNDQYDVSVEHQIGGNSLVRLSGYSKYIHNMLGTQQILPQLQSDLHAVYNLGNGVVDGVELSYEYLPPPPGAEGLSGFFSYANSGTGPSDGSQFNNLNQLIQQNFYNFDQTNTLSAGLAYSFRNGASAGLSLYYGDGLLSSATYLLNTPVRTGSRQSVSEVNLRMSTGPRWLGQHMGVEFMVENLFNSQNRYEFAGPLGTRYQQGRRVFIGLTGRL
jgi:outer membrane receptor protein involved in Fe transport